MQNIKNHKLKIIQRGYLTELKNIDKIVNDDKFILRYLANKIGTNIITDRRPHSNGGPIRRVPHPSALQVTALLGASAARGPSPKRVFIVGIYSSAFLQRLINKYLNKYPSGQSTAGSRL